MEIRIDTSKDSREEICKAIKFLQEIVGGAAASSQELPNEGENVMGGIFDLPAATSVDTPTETKPAVQETLAQKPKERIKYSGFEVY
jgi:hypothetical protein